jgi:hypothetical protein
MINEAKSESMRSCIRFLLRSEILFGFECYLIDRRFILMSSVAEPLVNVNIDRDTARNFLDSLENNELEKLVRVYTLYDRFVRFRGSVTAVPYLLRILAEREFESIEKLVNWAIIVNSNKNHYLPFGEMRYSGCKSYAEYVESVKNWSEKMGFNFVLF